ncbi:hypothetical protein AGMMS49991_12000 [Spirochaetia bacterium]|nr:hypothetical protein AGMMS49991_12000 [Spirochaetia bacterium]
MSVPFIQGDKKKKAGKSVFVVPAETGAELVPLDSEDPRLRSIINRAAGLETIIQ